MSEWKKFTISEFADVISGSTPSTDIPEYWNGDIEWVTPVDLSKLKSRFLKSTIRKISKKGLESSSTALIPAFNIVMSSRAPIGYFAIPTNKYTTNQGCKSFRLNSQHNAEFHYYNFLFNINYFKRYGIGSTFAEISKSDIEKLSFIIPTSLAEQQKIARILSTVDAVIEKTEAAIAKYKAIKAGMMHDLFTRGINEHGQLRPSYQQAPHLYKPSKLGWIPKDWEINELITVAKDNQYSFTGGPFGSDLKSSDYTKRGVRIIQLQNIGDGCFLNSYKIYTSEEKADNLSSCNIFPNNIIIAKMADPVARACIMPTFDNRYLMASDGIRLEVDEKRFNVSFVKESINSPYFRSRAINLSTGTTRARIGLSALKSILIKHPLLNEQNSISQKIETIDKKIELEQTTLNKYQKLKQGLMQDLLTGEVTVSV